MASTLEKPSDLLGLAEVADLMGLSKVALHHRRKSRFSASGRHPHRFPEPAAELRCGPIWRREQLERYIAAERRLQLHHELERRFQAASC